MIKIGRGIQFVLLLTVATGAGAYIFAGHLLSTGEANGDEALSSEQYPSFDLIMEQDVSRKPALYLAWSDDSSFVVQAGLPHGFSIWNAIVGSYTQSDIKVFGPVVVGESGDSIFFGSGPSADRRGYITEIDSQTFETIRILPRASEGQVSQMMFSPDRSRLIALHRDGKISIFNSQNWKTTATLARESRKEMRRIAVSPDNVHLAAADGFGGIFVWDYRDGKLVNQFEVHRFFSVIPSLTYNFDGSKLFTGKDHLSGAGEATITTIEHETGQKIVLAEPDLVRVWSTDRWEFMFGIDENVRRSGDVYALALSPDANLIAVSSQRETLQIFDAKTGKQARNLPVDFVVKSAAFSPNGQYLAAVTDFSLFIWRVAPPYTP